MTTNSTAANMGRSTSLPAVQRKLQIAKALDPSCIEHDWESVSKASSVSSPSDHSKEQNSWKSRQAASIESSLRRLQLQKQKQRASRDNEKRAHSIQFALRRSLRNCANVELKAWALAHAPQAKPAEEFTRLLDDAHNMKEAPTYHRLCGFLPTELGGINTLLSTLKLEPEHVFYDLGCGDGRIVMAVAKHFRCYGRGIEVNRLLVQQARCQMETEFVGDTEMLEKVKFIEDDISHVSLRDAQAVFIYMPSDAVHTLLSKVLPRCDLRDETLICVKDNWVRDPDALRNAKFVSSQWGGGIHCYKWQNH